MHRLTPDGLVQPAPPQRFGAIGNAHHIKLPVLEGDQSPWDESFENEFEAADGAFPQVIAWLSDLDQPNKIHTLPFGQRLRVLHEPEDRLRELVECVISLAVRSPRNREAAVSVAQELRGNIPSMQRRALIGGNLKVCQQRATQEIGTRGKIVVCHTRYQEFIFGDGFFHDFVSRQRQYSHFRLWVPLTPNVSVLFVLPRSFVPEPKLMSIALNDDEVRLFNETTQVYSKRELFYRSHQPNISPHFQREEHLEYEHGKNPIEKLIPSIPGVRRA